MFTDTAPKINDSDNNLLFKIAQMLNSGAGGGGGAGVASFNLRTGVVTLTSGDVTGALGFTPAASGSGVTSFNTRTGAVTLTSADVTTALGFTPLNTTTGDARYVLKTGDTMTGALAIGNGILVADTPYLNLSQTWNNGAVTFTGLQSNVTNTASSTNSNLFNFQVDGVDRFNFTPGGSLRAVRQDATDSGLNLFLRKRGNTGAATNAVANDATIGTVAYSAWDGTAFATGSRVSGLAAEAWTNIAHGARIDLYTTPTGSTTEQLTLRVASAGSVQFLNGTAALPAITFQSDLDTGMYRIGANSFGSSAGGSVILATSTTGINLTTALAYQYNGTNVIRAQTALNNYFFGPSGNLTMTGTDNTSIGFSALAGNTTGARNVAIGSSASLLNAAGTSNVAIGYLALALNTAGNSITAIGTEALFNSTGINNVGIGSAVLMDLTTGTRNTAIGFNTGRGITTGSNNTIVGASVLGLAAALSNNIILSDGVGVIRLQIDSSGNTTLAGTVQTAAGTAALPAFSFTADPNTGIYNIGADSLGISAGGVLALTTNATGIAIPAAAAVTWTSRGSLTRPADGVSLMLDNAGTSFGRLQFGGTTSSFPSIKRVSAKLAFRLADDSADASITAAGGTFSSALDVVDIDGTGHLIVGAAQYIRWSTRSVLNSPSDGVIQLLNSASADFNRLQFGGTTSSFPSIKRSAATIQFRLADDSAFAGIATAGIVMSLAAPLSFTSGANTRAGNAVLVAGTVTVANTSVTANTIVIVTRKTAGGTIGFAVTYTVIAATSFTLTSDSALDTSTYSYILIENP